MLILSFDLDSVSIRREGKAITTHKFSSNMGAGLKLCDLTLFDTPADDALNL